MSARTACSSAATDEPGYGARFAARFGIPHPVWCRRGECDLDPGAAPGTVIVWHIGVVLPVNELGGVELEQTDVVAVDGRHLARRAAQVRAYVPEDGGHLTAEQAGRLGEALAAARVLADDLPAFVAEQALAAAGDR